MIFKFKSIILGIIYLYN